MPGFGEWVVAARINFTTNGIVTMQRLAAASDLANASMMRQAGLIDKNELAMMRYQRRMEAFHAQQIKMGTMFAGGVALVGGAAIGTMVNQAAQFQRAMTGVNLATPQATAAQRAAMQSMAVQQSGMLAQSAVTIANEMRMAAITAFHDPKQLMTLFPMMAKYADVRYMAAGDDPVRSVEKMSQFAHFFAAYNPEQMGKMLDNTARLQFTTHAELNQLVTQGRYFIPNAVKLGVGQDTIFQYLAIMGQLGFLQGKGGTSLNNAILNAMSVTPTTHLSKAKAQGLHQLQMLNSDGTLKFIDSKGNLDLVGMITHLREIRDIMKKNEPRIGGSNWMRDVGAIFGKQGQVLVSALADNTTAGQMQRNRNAFGHIGGVDAQWHGYAGDFFYQWRVFVTNLQNLTMGPGLSRLNDLTRGLMGVNSVLQGMVKTLMDHPMLSRGVFDTVAWGTLAATIRFAMGGIVLLGRAIFGLGRTAAVTAPAVAGEGLAMGAGAAAGLGGFLGAADRFLFFGLIGAMTKMGAGIFPKIVVPILSFVNKLGPIGARLTSIALGTGGMISALEGITVALSKFALGPLSVIASVLGYQSSAGNAGEGVQGGMIGGHSLRYWSTHPHGRPQIAHDQLRQASVVIHNVNLNVDPKNASKDPVLQQLLQRSGVNKWSPLIPAPLTVGGAAFSR